VHGMQGSGPPVAHNGHRSAGIVQSLVHPSHSLPLPSSHCSPGSRIPLPHSSSLQLAEQPSPLVVFRSSHCSPHSSWMVPFPHTQGRGATRVQLAVHGSPCVPLRLPSSQSSLPSLTPFPRVSVWQVELQRSPDEELPSSHCSLRSTIPPPHTLSNREQSPLQPSQSAVCPSS